MPHEGLDPHPDALERVVDGPHLLFDVVRQSP